MPLSGPGSAHRTNTKIGTMTLEPQATDFGYIHCHGTVGMGLIGPRCALMKVAGLQQLWTVIARINIAAAS